MKRPPSTLPGLGFFLAGVIGFATEWAPTSAAEESRPNIVMIMADDLGYECIGANGSEIYETPHLDALAASGMRFEHAHAQPICTPTRVQIMTGIYNNRNYVKFGVLDPAATTFGQVLRDAGYQTCIAGKWQLSGGMEAPVKFGFEKFCLWQLTRRPSRYPNPGLEVDGVEKDYRNGEFGPDLVTDYIGSFLESRDPAKPFLVYYPMILPHWPFVPTPDSDDWDPTLWRDAKSEPGGFRDQTYWADDVAYTDKMVGKVVHQLERLGLRENTLVIFTGDNGTATEITSQFNGKSYPGGKGSTKDNGTHVPFIASWPAKIAPGTVSDELVDLSDLFPTFAELADVPESVGKTLDWDGVSLVPVFTGEGTRKKDYIYCYYSRDGDRGKASEHVRDREFKLYANGRFHHTGDDPREKTDLSRSLADSPKAAEAHARLKKALDHHRELTREADPIQNRKRKDIPRN